jgi:hypothetical protein
MKKTILLIVAVLVAGYIIFDKISDQTTSKEFFADQARKDSINKTLLATHIQDSIKKDSANKVLLVYKEQAEYLKSHAKVIVKYIDSSKATIDTYNDQQTKSFYNNRYKNVDTTINPLFLSHPVLIAAAKDLVELDGTKSLLINSDSLNKNYESQISTYHFKDSISTKQIFTLRTVITNQEGQLKDFRYEVGRLNNVVKKQQFKNKITKIGAVIVVGGLVHLMIAK